MEVKKEKTLVGVVTSHKAAAIGASLLIGISAGKFLFDLNTKVPVLNKAEARQKLLIIGIEGVE